MTVKKGIILKEEVGYVPMSTNKKNVTGGSKSESKKKENNKQSKNN